MPATWERVKALELAARTHLEAGRLIDAIAPFREIVLLSSNAPEAHYNLGLACLRSGSLAEASASLQRALELRPSFDGALRHLLTALEGQGKRSEALVVCRKLERAAGDPVERRYFLAKTRILEGQPDHAETELRRVLAVAPGNANARVVLGQLLAERGMFEEAQRHLSNAIDVLPATFHDLTVVKRMSDADRSLIERMRVLAEQPDLDREPRIAIHFGLGKAFDDLGDYAEAMHHYDAANRLKAATLRFDRTALAARYETIIARFTTATFEPMRRTLAGPACADDDMPVLIVGMPRSGTTLVEQILSSHPAVSAGGELPFWRKRLNSWQAPGVGDLDAAKLGEAAEGYRAELRKIGPAALRVTDKEPLNFELLGLIRLAFPSARIIHCRRNAVDTCLSIYFQNFRSADLRYGFDRGDLAFAYRQYERLMDHWRRTLLPEHFTEIEYETLVTDPEGEARRLVSFIGLEWDEACLVPERNHRVVQTASAWQVRQPVYKTSGDRWRRYQPWLGELGDLLPASSRAAS